MDWGKSMETVKQNKSPRIEMDVELCLRGETIVWG